MAAPTIYPTSNPNIPGGQVVLVDREQLRFRSHGRVCQIPRGFRALLEQIPNQNPPTFDWSKGESLVFPILGNNRYGDCYLACILHHAQAFTGNAGTECTFDEAAVIRRYLQLSPGDNGLGDQDVIPEFKGGLLGPNGPHKILDTLLLKIGDPASIALALWAFCGAWWTCSLGSGWENAAGPGAQWTPNNYGRPIGGHAMLLTGINSPENYDVRTWGIAPAVKVSRAGIQQSDSELVVCFSMEMFNAQGIAPCLANYDQLSTLWTQMGGMQLPPNPFPPSDPLDWLI